MKKVLSIVLVLGLLIPVSLYAEKKAFGNGLFWEVSTDGVLTISGNGPMPDYTREKKAPWAKYAKVTDYWTHDSKIKCVVIEEGITHIGSYSFYGLYYKDGCDYGKEVSLPNTLKSIGKDAFCCGIRRAKEIIFPPNLEVIEDGAFWGCKFKTVVFNENVKSIGECAFRGCDSLKTIVFPPTLETIGARAFLSCDSLKTIIFKGEVKSIGYDAFAYHEHWSFRDKQYFKPFVGEVFNLPEKFHSSDCGFSSSTKFYDSYRDANGKIIFEAKRGRNVYNHGNYLKVIENGTHGIADLFGNWIVPISANYKSIDEIKTKDGKKYYKVFKDGKYGLMDDNFRLKFLIDCSSLEEEATDLWLYKSGDNKGIIRTDGQIVIPASRGYYTITYNKGDNTFIFYVYGGYVGRCDINGNEKYREITEFGIELKNGYSSVTAIDGISPKRYKVSKDGYYGITDAGGNTLVPPEMDEIETIGGGLLKFKIGSFWGVMDKNGKTIVPTSRGYTSIGRYIVTQNTFSFTKANGKGECNGNGNQISFIENKVNRTANEGTVKRTDEGKRQTETKPAPETPQRVIVEHHRDPVPVNVWIPCGGCSPFAPGQCNQCNGTGSNLYGSGLCRSCHGSGRCHFCNGQGGHYEVQYK